MTRTYFTKIIWVLLVGAWVGACGQKNSQREAINAENAAQTEAKLGELITAKGTYRGAMHLLSSGQDFDVSLQIEPFIETAPAPQSPEGTETIEIPRLSGNMHFPILDRLKPTERSAFVEIMGPMGQYSTVLFNFGNYNPKKFRIILPYSVSGYNGTFGELTGTLESDPQGKKHFKGSWYSKPFGTVGSFDLIQEKTL